MNAYETIDMFKPLAGTLAVITILGKIFIPKGTGKTIFLNVMLTIFVLMCLAMGYVGYSLLCLTLAGAFAWLTIDFRLNQRHGLSFIFFILTIIFAVAFYRLGQHAYIVSNY